MMKRMDPAKFVVWVNHDNYGNWAHSDELDGMEAVLDYLTSFEVAGKQYVVTKPVDVALGLGASHAQYR